MAENVSRLQYGDKEIILVGTAHISETSVTLVRETIEAERPNSVCIELDEARYKNIQDPRAWERTDITQVIRQKKVGMMLAQLLISSYQKRMAKKLGTKVGGEMIQGIASAEEVGAEIVLADRNIQTTFLRLWRLLRAREKFKLAYGLMLGDDEDDGELTEDDIAALLQQDMLESVLGEVKGEFPVIGEVLIDERDQYLANKIKEAPGPKVLAVLGAAHVPGVTEEIFKEQDMEAISTIPAKKSRAKYIFWLIPIIVVGLIVYGFVTRGVETGLQNLLAWVLWNGGLSALGALLVLAHPLSILTAFLAAPFTTAAPGLAAGWFAGLTEAWVRKPRVEDMQKIPEDIFRFKGWYQNRVLKILAVVILANLGSFIGTFPAVAEMARNVVGG
ncbi:MAG: TraB/GumN family protein [Oscillospiraceae bacterium]|nr:TraB/GumN family protein [Oscillospiraceae bacterium]